MIRARPETATTPKPDMSMDIPFDHPLQNPSYVAGLAHGTALRLDALEKRLAKLEAAQQQHQAPVPADYDTHALPLLAGEVEG